MPRSNVIYQAENVYVSQCGPMDPHFLTSSGTLANSGMINLVRPLTRVQEVSYVINKNESQYTQLGKRGTIIKDQLFRPTIDLSISWLIHGLINEYNIGFNVNYLNVYGDNSGVAQNPANNSFLLSDLINRTNDRYQNDLNWPPKNRDKKNIFVAVEKRKGFDLNVVGATQYHPNQANLYVYAFGNCYLTSYTVRASVGEMTSAGATFLCENMEIFSSGRNLPVPGVDSNASGSPISTFSIPPQRQFDRQVTSVLTPQYIRTNISAYNQPTGINAISGFGATTGSYLPELTDFGSSWSDIKLQGYEISLDLSRENVNDLRYVLPLDRVINFPIFASVSMDAIVGDSVTGDFSDFLNNNKEYYINIKMDNRDRVLPVGTIVQYDFKKASLLSYSYNTNIGNSKRLRMNFDCEIDPDNLNKGFFISGLMNMGLGDIFGKYYLLQEDGASYVLQEDGVSRIVIQDFQFIG